VVLHLLASLRERSNASRGRETKLAKLRNMKSSALASTAVC
jgi:hypothetical protein